MECNMTSTFSVGKDVNFCNEILLDKANSCPSSLYVVHYLTLPHVQKKIMIHVYYKTPILQHSLPLRTGNLPVVNP
jgi:hypothetical protein